MTSGRATFAVALLALGAGCGGPDGVTDAIVEADGIAVLDAWVRPTPGGADEAALYVTVENRAAPDDRLVGAESEHCMVVTPHLTEIVDEIATMDVAGSDQLGLARGERVEMGPLGLHLMCLGLAEPLAPGDEVPLELRFSTHDPIRVSVVVEQR